MERSEKRRLLSNIVSLTILQGTNYLLPLLTFPYLVRVLGADKFGLLAFAGATVGYVVILVNYGFNLSATKDVAVHRDNPAKLEEIYGAVLMLQAMLFALSALLFGALSTYVEMFAAERVVFWLTFATVAGRVLFPQWLFQGLERMRFITGLNIAGRVAFAAAVFVWIKTREDYWMVPMLNALAFLLVGIAAQYIIRYHFGIRFRLPSWRTAKRYAVEGWHIFLSNVAISLYTVTATFILGLFADMATVGYYAAADKIRMAFQGLLSPVSQALYPYIANKVSHAKSEAVPTLRRLVGLMGAMGVLISAALFLFADVWVSLLLGEGYARSAEVLRWLAWLPLLIALSNVFGIQTMVTFGMKHLFSTILIIGSIFHLVLSFVVVPFYGELGTAWCVLATETFVTAAMWVALRRRGIDLIKGKANV